MQLACWALEHFPTSSHVRRGFSHCSNCRSPQSILSLSFPFSQPLPRGPPPHHSQPHPHGPLPCCGFSLFARLTSLIGLVDFFISLVVGVPCSLIFWHFWLFIDFRLVVILLLVVQGSEGFLPTPPSWLEPDIFHLNYFIVII